MKQAVNKFFMVSIYVIFVAIIVLFTANKEQR